METFANINYFFITFHDPAMIFLRCLLSSLQLWKQRCWVLQNISDRPHTCKRHLRALYHTDEHVHIKLKKPNFINSNSFDPNWVGGCEFEALKTKKQLVPSNKFSKIFFFWLKLWSLTFLTYNFEYTFIGQNDTNLKQPQSFLLAKTKTSSWNIFSSSPHKIYHCVSLLL